MSARAVRREGHWSPEGPLDVTEAPTGALLRNVDARTLTSPVQGFGKLWRKKYEMQPAHPPPLPPPPPRRRRSAARRGLLSASAHRPPP